MGKEQLNGGSNKILSYLFVILAVVFFLVGLWKFISYITFIGTCEKVDAVVVEIDDATSSYTMGGHRHDHETKILFANYVTYTYQGQTYEHIRLDGDGDVYEGCELEVYVDKNDPTDARLPGNNLYQACVMMIMMPIFWIVARCINNKENN